MASNSIKNGLQNMFKARQNNNAIVFESLDELDNKKLFDKLKLLGVPRNAKGVFFNADSYESKKIADAPKLDIYIKNMIKNGCKPLNNENICLSIRNLRFWDLKNNIDRQGSLQNVTVFEPQITKNGKFKCKIVDYSDFKPSKSGDAKFANDWGYSMQEKGLYKNYFQIYEIEKDILKRYLSNKMNLIFTLFLVIDLIILLLYYLTSNVIHSRDICFYILGVSLLFAYLPFYIVHLIYKKT